MDEAKYGLFASLGRIADTTIATAHTRLELLALEAHQEKCRLIQALLIAAVLTALGVGAVTLLTIALVVLFWETGPVPALCIISGLFAMGAVFALKLLRKRMSDGPPFESTLNELKKDLQCLRQTD